MFSIQRCREILGTDAPKSDAEIEKVRDQLYAIADVWLARGAEVPPTPAAALFASLSEDDRFEVEERAALMEFDGRLLRDHAERVAFATIMLRGSRGPLH